MATCIKPRTSRTVGELIESLQRFPLDMPIECDMNDCVTVYHEKPDKSETTADKRGVIVLNGDDPWG